MKKAYTIYGEKIILRSINEDDLELIRSWRNQENIRKWFFDSSIIAEEKQAVWFSNYLNRDNDLMCMIEYKKTGNMIGTAALYNIDFIEGNAEFGRVMIGVESARSKGLAVQVTKELCNFGFNEIGLKKIYLNIFKDNIPALKAYERAGFKTLYEYEKSNRLLINMVLIRGD